MGTISDGAMPKTVFRPFGAALSSASTPRLAPLRGSRLGQLTHNIEDL